MARHGLSEGRRPAGLRFRRGGKPRPAERASGALVVADRGVGLIGKAASRNAAKPTSRSSSGETLAAPLQ
jgi:hypothetical protein